MNDPVSLRRYVREVLALRSDRKFTEKMLFEGVRVLAPDPLKVDELREAMEWNQARAYIERTPDDDLEEDVFFLTNKGRAKEGLALK